jgi:hypothetical protein
LAGIVVVRVVNVGFDWRGKVVDGVDRAHETVDSQHERERQKRDDAGPSRAEQA